MREVLGRYPKGAEIVYGQEEPRNAGSGLFVLDRLRDELGINARFMGRPASPTPAVGSKRAHKKEQDALLTAIIGALPASDVDNTRPVAHAGAKS